MKAPVGAQVGLFYDGERLHAGDYLETETGRVYRVVHVRVQEGGKHRGRQHLQALVQSSWPAGARILPLRWYARGKGSRTRRRA